MPHVTWTKDGAELQISKRIKITNKNQTVKIFSASVEGVGMYRCTAENALGVINATMYLHVMPGMCTAPVEINQYKNCNVPHCESIITRA